MQDPQQLYYEIVSTSLEKIRKALPKKLKPLKETIISFQGFHFHLFKSFFPLIFFLSRTTQKR